MQYLLFAPRSLVLQISFAVIATILSEGMLLGQAKVSPPEPRQARFRESVALSIDAQVVKALATAQDHIAEKQWPQAFSLLQQLLETQGDSLVPVDVGRYWNATDYCHLLISRMPPDALAAYRTRVDPQVQAWFEVGQRELDEELLRRVVEIGFNSTYGDDALWLLGELSFERGRFALARSYWELLVPSVLTPSGDGIARADVANFERSYPNPDIEAAAIRARLVLCSIFGGELNRADAELTAFRKLHPAASGELAGRDGSLVTILEEIRKDAVGWPFSRMAQGEYPTFAGHPERSQVQSHVVEPTAVRWRSSLPVNRFSAAPARPAFQEQGHLSSFPAVWGNTVFACNSDAVFAYDLSTGMPKWPRANQNDGLIYSNVEESPPSLRSSEIAGVAYYSVTIDGGRLFARLGPPIIRKAPHDTDTFSEIVGLDIGASQGRLFFHLTSDVLDDATTSPQATTWVFEGTPLISGNRLFVSARCSVPEDEIHVACFDIESQQAIWRRHVCSPLRNAAEHLNWIGHRLLTMGDGRLFLDTGTGAVAALDAASGRIKWVATYESQVGDDSPTTASDPARIGLTPCVYHDGIVFAAPTDANSLLALDATTGQVRWEQRLTDRIQYLLGVVDQKLIVSGRNLWAFDVQTGKLAWPNQKVGFSDAAGQGYGRGCLAGDSILWPLREELWRVDARTGDVLQRYAIQQATGERGGHLVCAADVLIVAQPDQLVGFGEPLEPSPLKPARASIAPSTDDASGQAVTIRPSTRAPIMEFNRSPSFETTAAASYSQNKVVSPWPARRAWSVQLSPQARIAVPHQQPVHHQQQLVLVQNGHRVAALGVPDGAERWRAALAHRMEWAELADDLIVVGHRQGLEARHLTTGRSRWRFDLPLHDAREQLLGFRLIIDQHMVTWTPSAYYVVHVPTGRIHERRLTLENHVGATSMSSASGSAFQAIGATNVLDGFGAHVLVRRSKPAQLALVDLRTGGEQAFAFGHSGVREAIVASVLDGPDKVVVLRSDHRLESWTQSGTLAWKYADRISASYYPPRILKADSLVILVEDGLFARGIKPESGEVAWSATLGRYPFDRVSDVFAVTNQYLFSISEGVAKSFQIEDGRLLWSRFLGPEEWRLEAAPTETVWIGRDGSSHANAETQGNVRLVVCDNSSGALIQSIYVRARANAVSCHNRDGFSLVVADELICLRPWQRGLSSAKGE